MRDPNFIIVSIDLSSIEQLTISNVSSQAVVVNGTPPSAPFSASPAFPLNLGANQSVTQTVTFTPTTANTFSSTITFSAPGQPPISVPVSGTGVASTLPIVSVSPAAINFGARAGNQIITINNTGPGPLNIGNISLNGTGASSYSFTSSCTTVFSGSSCQLTVTFQPKQGGKTYPASLTLSDNATPPTQAVLLYGIEPVTVLPGITMTPVALNFGAISKGNSETLFLKLAISTPCNPIITGISVDNPDYTFTAYSFNGSGYSQITSFPSGLSCITVGGAQALILVTFSPSGAYGYDNGIITIETDQQIIQVVLAGNNSPIPSPGSSTPEFSTGILGITGKLPPLVHFPQILLTGCTAVQLSLTSDPTAKFNWIASSFYAGDIALLPEPTSEIRLAGLKFPVSSAQLPVTAYLVLDSAGSRSGTQNLDRVDFFSDDPNGVGNFSLFAEQFIANPSLSITAQPACIHIVNGTGSTRLFNSSGGGTFVITGVIGLPANFTTNLPITLSSNATFIITETKAIPFQFGSIQLSGITSQLYFIAF